MRTTFWFGLAAFLSLLVAGCSDRAASSSPPSLSPSTVATASQPSPSPRPSATASPTGTASSTWRSCAGRFECADLTVPLDYSGATPGTIKIAVMRWPAASRANRIGALLTDPGGPGGSGINFLQSGSVQSWSELHQRFDIVGFDPRGVGASGQVECVDSLDDYFHVATPYSQADMTALEATTRRFAEGCTQRSGKLLGFLGAPSVAADMDQIRIALGEEKISYLGLSYGTYLGAMYADLFPGRVRAFVLDGAVDPALPAKEYQRQQAIGFETAFDAFAANCTTDPACPLARLPGGASGSFDRMMASLQANPLPVGSRSLGRSEAEIGVGAALYSRSAWPRLAAAMAAALAGNGTDLLALCDSYTERRPDGAAAPFFVAYKAITCIDLAFPRTLAEFDAWAAEFARTAPRFGRELAYEHVDCAWWPVPPTTHRPITAAGAPPILVVGTTRDPATPLAWAAGLAAELTSGVLLKVDGDGHTAYGRNTCATNRENAYLIDLTVPATGTTC